MLPKSSAGKSLAQVTIVEPTPVECVFGRAGLDQLRAHRIEHHRDVARRLIVNVISLFSWIFIGLYFFYVLLLQMDIGQDAKPVVFVFFWALALSLALLNFIDLLLLLMLMKVSGKETLLVKGEYWSKTDWRVRAPTATQMLVLLGGNLISLFFLLTSFATGAYPRIPEQVGGGQPKIVQFIFFSDNLEEASQTGLALQGLRSVPVPLLWEGDSMYLVSLPEHPSPGWTAQINKTLVAGVLTVPQPRPAEILLPLEWSPGNMSFATPEPSATE